MTYQFRTPGFYYIIDSIASVVEIGKHIQLEDAVLDSAYLGIYCVGDRVGGEKLKFRLHTSQNYNKVYAEAEVDLDELQIPSNWIGRVLFNFNLEPLNLNQNYWITVIAENYLRNGYTDFIALTYDRPQDNDQKLYGTLAKTITPAPSTGWFNDYAIEHKLLSKK